MQQAHQVLIVGCGDVGRRLARRLSAEGVAVTAWARSARSADFGKVVAVDLDAKQALPETRAQSCVYLVPPPRSGTVDARLARFLAESGESIRHVVYAGTSGVYGDCGGRWVDETAPLNPADDRAARRVDAEQQIVDWAAAGGGTAVRLRLAGIYGPGRLPRARIERGDPVVLREQASWSNRVHVDDVVSAAVSALQHSEHMAAGESFAVNVADGVPTTMTDYLQVCAKILGLPALPELPLGAVLDQASPMLRSFLTQSRRLRIDRLTGRLNAPPQHTDFRQALREIVKQPLR